MLILLVFLWPVPAFAQSEEDQFKLIEVQIQALSGEIENLKDSIYSLLYFRNGFLDPLPETETREIIDQSIEWFKTAQEENGHFRYEYVPYDNEYLDLDHIVRQAGAFYILGEVAAKDVSGKYNLKPYLERSIEFFESLTISGTYDGKIFGCVADNKNSSVCTMGTTALVAVGIADYMKAYPDGSDYTVLLDSYIDYILAMKMGGQGFRSHFYNNSGSQTDSESSYSNGEALLALVRYYRFNPGSEVRKIIDDMFSYIESIPYDSALYLWAMAAIKDLQEIRPDQRYLNYVKGYTDWRTRQFRGSYGSQNNLCAYIEGVISAYSVYPEKDYLREIEFWLYKSSKLQIRDDDLHRFVFTDGRFSLASIENKERALGGFLTSRHKLTQRIDYTQHCLSSYLQKLTDIDNRNL